MPTYELTSLVVQEVLAYWDHQEHPDPHKRRTHARETVVVVVTILYSPYLTMGSRRSNDTSYGKQALSLQESELLNC